jgi:hypothetical protein
VPRPQAFYEDLAARHALDFSVMGPLKALGYPKDAEGGNGIMLRFARSPGR